MVHHVSGEGKKGDIANLRGHYVTFTRTSSGMWVRYDDLKVSKVHASKVLTNRVYLVSYTKRR